MDSGSQLGNLPPWLTIKHLQDMRLCGLQSGGVDKPLDRILSLQLSYRPSIPCFYNPGQIHNYFMFLAPVGI